MTDPGPEARDRLLARVEAELAADRKWRAREILQGSMSQFATDTVVLETYARVLDSLGDRIEAGKYYFLSGSRDTEANASIALFLDRHGKGHVNNLIAQFPSAVANAGLEAFPAIVMEELEALGLPKDRADRSSFSGRTTGDARRDLLLKIGCALVSLLTAFVFLVGVVAIVSWVTGRL